MPDDPNTRTLPPDPSVPGLWWLRSGEWWRVWQWEPGRVLVPSYWHTGDSFLWPDKAYAAGWRCIEPAVPPSMDWHIIDTAPRDGTHVLIGRPSAEPTLAAWDGATGKWRGGAGIPIRDDVHPTHWMPLPTAPAVPPEGA